jgi:hypothetical protein
MKEIADRRKWKSTEHRNQRTAASKLTAELNINS